MVGLLLTRLSGRLSGQIDLDGIPRSQARNWSQESETCGALPFCFSPYQDPLYSCNAKENHALIALRKVIL